MRKLLQDNVSLSEVETILATVEAGNELSFPSDAYNGFFACIAMSRHAYRWATIPVIKAAQKEKFIDLPPELELPWSFLRQHYGVTSQGGNCTSNYFYNFDARENLVYQINCSSTETIRSAEYHFAHMFPVMEKLALPIYHDIVKSIISFEQGQRDKCLHFLKSINTQLRLPLKVFYDTLVDSKIPRSVWLSYVQGFQGWAAGEIIDGKYVEYDGLSGNQLPLFQVVDAFIGLDRYLNEENVHRYMPLSQRKLTTSLRQHSFRRKAKEDGDSEIEAEMLKIVKQLRVFRLAHRARARPYLSTDAPERLIMTAGKSILESSTVKNIKAAIDFLDAMLVKRLRETL
ncbi:hypothetical protein Egran_05001 [Elaphomyces granulatus]|uniref:Indoleamine 2,3-dioxygenase n=1 Tax=Elaphomyces granulatus TaxID=519963 RepID=A0A232LSW2_9EURO|nr:hypothetical protein Egran_05001 [Elaphomyces granulatus]